jgi:lipoate-protein ligase A
MHWKFVDTGNHPGTFNMEFDESLVHSLAEGNGISTVRVYGWKPTAISLGWNQSMDEIDISKATRDGIDIVRRPTGGRAILHSEELTYCVTMGSPAKRVLAVYNEISQALVQGLKMLGVDVTLEKSQPHFPSLYRSTSSAACFSSSARYEIQIGGRKLVGSAQRRYVGKNGEEIVLQHGSLLLGPDHQRLIEYLNLQNELDRERLKLEIDKKTIDLSKALGRVVTFDECAEAVRTGFEEAWGIKFDFANQEHTMTGAYS